MSVNFGSREAVVGSAFKPLKPQCFIHDVGDYKVNLYKFQASLVDSILSMAKPVATLLFEEQFL